MVLTLKCIACDKDLTDKDMYYDEVLQDYNDLCYECRTHCGLTKIEQEGEGNEKKSD